MNKKVKKAIKIIASLIGIVFVILAIIAKRTKKDTVYENNPEEKNPMEGKKVIFVESEDDAENADGVKGHLEAVGDSEYHPGFYEKYIKRLIDIVLSFAGLVVLSPVFAAIAIAIKIEDPGPVFFTQKRVGQNKQYFKLHKFRSMKVSTPHDVPTHMLENPEQYITKVGGFIRRHSLDELPQIWDIFVGNLTTIGPRPGLWNQDRLTAERDKYGANDVKPGLTGWAQINGRDELEIPEKARLDGEYVQKLNLGMDIKCFLGSLHVIGKDKNIVEGGTGQLKRGLNEEQSKNETIKAIKPREKKKILVVGKNSYIGTTVVDYLSALPEYYEVDTIEAKGLVPVPDIFKGYDVLFDVAGIAHIKETNENKILFYEVNRDLTVRIAEAAKDAGVRYFIFLSSMSVYGKEKGHITLLTEPDPYTAYGKSKLEADRVLLQMNCETFKVAILRPPMVYGKNCKGNYQLLRRIAIKSPVFPSYYNQRSMIYIGNLCEFIKRIIDGEYSGIFLPQNSEYVCTSNMVAVISDINGKKCKKISVFNILIKLFPIGLLNKAFGDLTYEKIHTISKYSFSESMKLTETE